MNKTMQRISDATTTVIQHGGRRNIGNYRVFEDGGFVVVEYRGTDVATFDVGPKRRVRLNTGTYYTATTKNVMNAALRGAQAPYTVFQKDYSWFIDDDGRGPVDFIDNEWITM